VARGARIVALHLDLTFFPSTELSNPRRFIPMKRLFTCLGFVALSASLLAQKAPPASPAATETATIGGNTISISYSAPSVKGRGGQLFTKDGRISKDPTYPVWRAGANSATRLHTDANLDIAGLSVPKGDYTLYVDISDPAHWVLVVNKQVGQWGTIYDKAQDLGRVAMTTEATPALVEHLKYSIEDKGKGKAKLTLAWENLCGSVAVTVK
jgi:hypothetical protein